MTTTSSGHRLLLTLPDVAALARVQRPVVSMWRTRSVATDNPFPEPAVRSGTQVLLDADEVADWLLATGHGNNPDVREELALFAAIDAASTAPGAPDRAAAFAGLTALLAVKATTGEPLTGLRPAELLDLADDVDPHDTALYTEVAALGEHLQDLAAHADAVASAAYTPAAAVEALMAHRFRHGPRAYADTALTPAALDLTARLAAALLGEPAPAPGPTSEATVVDPSGGSDLLVALRRRLADADLPTLALPSTRAGSHMVRLARRRLLAHGWWPGDVAADDAGRLALPGRTLVLAQFPSPDRPVMSDEEVLAAIDDVAVAMDDDDRAVVIGPASALADRPRTAAVDAARTDLLRTDRVRAVVRLPAGLWVSRPRQRLALWVLGPAHPAVPIGRRWTTVSDLGGITLTGTVVEDVVTDVVASLGDRDTVRAHTFRFARFVATSTLLAGSGDLVGTPTPRPPRPRTAPAETALRVQDLIAQASRPPTAPDLRLPVEHREPTSTRTATLGDLLAAGAARAIPGNRLDPADIGSGGSVRVIGPEEVLGIRPVGERTLDRLAFSTRYPAGRYTEPGDIVFCTTPEVGAVVDVEGFSVVAAPARVLRLDRTREPGLIADVVTQDLRTASPKARWRSWAVRLAPASQAAALEAALAVVGQHLAAAQARLRALSDLAETLTDGVVTGALTVTTPPHPAQEG